MKGVLVRTYQNSKESLGRLTIFEGIDQVFTCKTLEPAWKDNQTGISCIPDGTYEVGLRESPKYGMTYHIKDVVDRSYILIHAGNYYTHTRGCVLVGEGYADINKDGIIDITYSKSALKKLMESASPNWTLTVKTI